MVLIWAIVALLLSLTAPSAWATTRYASNNGTGSSPCTTSSPSASRCAPLTAINLAVAEDVIQLLGSGDMDNPNVYTGVNYMLTITNRNGTSSQPITLGCYTSGGVADPGGCLIDAEFASGRTPVVLTNSTYWVIQDINARNGSTSVFHFSAGATNNTMQRIVGWDTDITQNSGILKSTGNDGPNYFIDAAAFGTARKLLSGSQNGNNLICRRCWIRWEGNTREGPKVASTQQYTSHDYTCENCLFTWSAESMPQTYTLNDPSNVVPGNPNNYVNYQVQNPVGLVSRDNVSPTCANITIRGSIGYVTATDRHPAQPSSGTLVSANSFGFGAGQQSQTCATYSHLIFVVDPTNINATHWYGFHLDNATGNTASHLTTIAPGSTPDVLAWGGSDRQRFTALASAVVAGASPWIGTIGGQVCYKTEAGVTGTDPLWPWPMNDRILAATGYAGAYAGPCTNCTGGRAARTATDVTASIEAVLGTIPSTCRSASTGGAPPGFTPSSGPSHGSLDTFGGSGMGGWTSVSGSGWTEAGGVATPTSGFSTVLWDSLFQTNGQEAGCEISALGTEGGTGFLLNFLGQDNNNRYRVEFKTVAGSDNDTYTVQQVSNGSVTDVVATTSLGLDIGVGDKVLARMTSGTDVSLQYFIAGDQWYEFDTFSVTSPPSSSKVGMGAVPNWSCTDFFGGGTAAGGDVTAPTAPSNLVVTPQSSGLVTLTWDASTDAVGVTGYLPERGVQSNCSDCALISTLQVGTTYLDASVSAGTVYYYRVRSTDLAGNLSGYSNVVSGRTPDTAGFAGSSGRLR